MPLWFSIFGSTFEICLEIFQICIENNLVLSWEKILYHGTKGIV